MGLPSTMLRFLCILVCYVYCFTRFASGLHWIRVHTCGSRMKPGMLRFASLKPVEENSIAICNADSRQSTPIVYNVPGVWDLAFNVSTVLDPDLITEYTEFYRKVIANGNQLISMQIIRNWDDIKALLTEGRLTDQALEQTWLEASQGREGIDLDRFLRWNVRLDQVITGTPTSITTSSTNPSTPPPENQTDSNSMFDELKGIVSEEELILLRALDQADALMSTGSYRAFESLTNPNQPTQVEDLEASRDRSTDLLLADDAEADQYTPQDLPFLLQTALALGRLQVQAGVGADHSDEDIGKEPTVSQHLRTILRAISGLSPLVWAMAPPANSSSDSNTDMSTAVDGAVNEGSVVDSAERTAVLNKVKQSLVGGPWHLLFSNAEMLSFYRGVTGFANVLPGARFESLSVQYISDDFQQDVTYTELLKTPLGNLAATVQASWELTCEESFITGRDSLVLRSYVRSVKAGPFRYEAQENWKSLRTLAMNEVVYVDEKVLLLRNCGALRVYYLFERA